MVANPSLGRLINGGPTVFFAGYSLEVYHLITQHRAAQSILSRYTTFMSQTREMSMHRLVHIPRRNIIITLPNEVIQLLAGKDDEAEERATLAWTCAELRAILLPRTPPAVMVYVAIRSFEMKNKLLSYRIFGVRGIRMGLRYAGHVDDNIWVSPVWDYTAEFEWSPHPKLYAIVEMVKYYHFHLPIITFLHQHLTYAHDSILAGLKMAIQVDCWKAAETLLEYGTQEQLGEAVLEALRFGTIKTAENILQYMHPEGATNLAWDITTRAVRYIDQQMLRNILACNGEVYGRFQIDQVLIEAFKPLLYLAKCVCDSDISRIGLLSVWKQMIDFSDVQEEDDEESNVLHILAQYGGDRYHRRASLNGNPDEQLVEPTQSPAFNTDERTMESSNQALNGEAWTVDNKVPGQPSPQSNEDDSEDVEELAGDTDDAEGAEGTVLKASEYELEPSIEDTYRSCLGK